MTSGDSTLCRFETGGSITVVLDDRVLPDRTCNQWDAGWWVFDPADIIGKDGDYDECRSYFLSDSGILYRQAEKTTEQGFVHACGYSPEFIRAERKREMRDAAIFYEGKSFDRKYGSQMDGLT